MRITPLSKWFVKGVSIYSSLDQPYLGRLETPMAINRLRPSWDDFASRRSWISSRNPGVSKEKHYFMTTIIIQGAWMSQEVRIDG